MSKFLIPLLFVITTAHADNHGYRLSLYSPEVGKIFSNIVIRSRPTQNENYDLCVQDGEFLLRKYPTYSYTCEGE